MSIVSTSAHTESPSEEQGDVVVHDRRVTVDGITAQYLEAGTGPTLLLLHGHEQDQMLGPAELKPCCSGAPFSR
jgi:hypothetical protein